MAVKKAASRKRTTTKRATKTTRSVTKRAAARPRSAAAESERAAHDAPPTPIELFPVAEPVVAEPLAAEPVAAEPVAPERPAAKPARAKPAPDARPAERPSRFTADHYLYAKGPEPVEGLVRRPGKWMIFVSRSRVDALWEQIRRAVAAGRLGYAAKVSTALPNPLSPDPKKHVICVYTADENDPADVRRVRDVLRGIGVTWRIPYKSDAATRAGQHEVTIGGPAAKYYE